MTSRHVEIGTGRVSELLEADVVEEERVGGWRGECIQQEGEEGEREEKRYV